MHFLYGRTQDLATSQRISLQIRAGASEEEAHFGEGRLLEGRQTGRPAHPSCRVEQLAYLGANPNALGSIFYMGDLKIWPQVRGSLFRLELEHSRRRPIFEKAGSWKGGKLGGLCIHLVE